MKFERLSKKEALRLVTPVIDGEACRKTQKLFFNNIHHYPEVSNRYKSNCRVKKLLQRRCPRAKAPDHLHDHIKSVIALQKGSNLLKN